MDQRSELTEVKAERAVMEREVHDQLLQLHSLQLQLYAKQGQAEDSDTIKDRLVGRTSGNTPIEVMVKLQNTDERRRTTDIYSIHAITDCVLHLSCGFAFLCFTDYMNG